MQRRGFLLGLGAALAAPAIVRAEVLMPVRKLVTFNEQSLMAVIECIPRWVPCDGRELSRALYADLFSALGTQFGAGDGKTTFAVPDLTPNWPVTRDERSTRIVGRDVISTCNSDDPMLPAGTLSMKWYQPHFLGETH